MIAEQAKIRHLTPSAYVRQIITLGLSISTSASTQDDNTLSTCAPASIQVAGHSEREWNKLLAWILETRFLMRSLIKQFLEPEEENQPSVLDMAKTEAEKYVDQFLKNRTGNQ